MENIYFFHWPSNLGGADTRLKDAIELFSGSNKYNLFCIPNDDFRLKEKDNIDFLTKNNVKILTWDTLPTHTKGYAIAFCNFRLFQESWRLEKIKNIGLKFIWSNDMMWSSQEEADAFEKNLVSAAIFTSDFHQNRLAKVNPSFSKIQNYIVPNYFNSIKYKRISKKSYLNDKFVIGKLSRAEWTKYGENFPLFYKKIDIPNAHFRFMGWDEKLKQKYSWFNFEKNFEILQEKSESAVEFLSQLDIYVFTCHHNYTENQSRSIVEAQLMGIPCIVPNEGNFPNMIWHERTGYIYNTIEECHEYILKLYNDNDLLNTLGYNSKIIAETIWANKNSQLSLWENIFKNI
jgi:glycosyltransferase involved in cell wall biosynthesis